MLWGKAISHSNRAVSPLWFRNPCMAIAKPFWLFAYGQKTISWPLLWQFVTYDSELAEFTYLQQYCIKYLEGDWCNAYSSLLGFALRTGRGSILSQKNLDYMVTQFVYEAAKRFLQFSWLVNLLATIVTGFSMCELLPILSRFCATWLLQWVRYTRKFSQCSLDCCKAYCK
jgi:hypothetical protein